jgi:hypothetical protein
MKFKKLLSSLLVEASKKDILINKLGVNEYNANALSEVAGPLSVFFAYKILEKYEEEYYDTADRAKEIIKKNQISTFNRMALVNGSNSFVRERDKLRGIMDWVRVGLAGNIKPYQELTFIELYDESERWHESLGIGDSKIDYNEENVVILDFRKNDEGYYWVDLGSGKCPDEAERMGHCASSRGNLYSLRSFKKIENNHTLNRSHLTASIDDDGNLLQLKGQKNSKPTNEYHKLIVPLFYLEKNDGKFLIDGFGYEYNTENDFKISDLTTEEITKLYSERPALFSGRQETKVLKNLGLVDSPKTEYKFTLTIPVKYASDYIRGELKDSVNDILMGDTWQYWDNYEYADWESSIQYHIDEENTQKIINMLRNSEGFDEDLSLIDLIKECDDTEEIKSALRSATNDAEANDYESYLYKELESAFSEFGDVTSMNDMGVVIEVDLESLIESNNIDDEIVDEIADRCEKPNEIDSQCMFEELLSEGYIEKPRFDVDNRWYPSIDNNNFNDILNDRLNEI